MFKKNTHRKIKKYSLVFQQNIYHQEKKSCAWKKETYTGRAKHNKEILYTKKDTKEKTCRWKGEKKEKRW